MFQKTQTDTPKRALLVDDDIPILRALDARLKHSGFEVAVMKDSSMALAHIDHFKPDIALLDINMPGLDGFQLAQKILAKHPTCGLIFITANVAEGIRTQADDLGGVLHEKPFDSGRLMKDLDALIGEK